MKRSTPTVVDFFVSEGDPVSFCCKDYLFHQFDAIHWMYWLIDGGVNLLRQNEDGGIAILHSRRSGLIAEASLYSDVYHCDGVVVMDSRLIRLPKKIIQNALLADALLHQEFSKYLADNLREARGLLELRSHKRLSERLDIWLLTRDKTRLKPGSLYLVAEELGVSKEALYRELAKRRKAEMNS